VPNTSLHFTSLSTNCVGKAKVRSNLGFTLIELSIVLVIIGLVIGGVLVGRDLISAAAVRSQISQIEKYQTAVRTFNLKYGGLPGDLSPSIAGQFGLIVGSNCGGVNQGERDGNGLLDGAISPNIYSQVYGETGLFWQDLSSSLLIDATIPNSGGLAIGCNTCISLSASQISQYFPLAKIGNGNYIYVYEDNGYNWFGVLGINGISACSNMNATFTAIPVIQAYNIDKKIDDAIPALGNIQAKYTANQILITQAHAAWTNNDPLNCYDGNPVTFPNGGAYSINAAAGNNSNLPNCALSFKFQ